VVHKRLIKAAVDDGCASVAQNTFLISWLPDSIRPPTLGACPRMELCCTRRLREGQQLASTAVDLRRLHRFRCQVDRRNKYCVYIWRPLRGV